MAPAMRATGINVARKVDADGDVVSELPALLVMLANNNSIAALSGGVDATLDGALYVVLSVGRGEKKKKEWSSDAINIIR